jgi:hypothetical protein
MRSAEADSLPILIASVPGPPRRAGLRYAVPRGGTGFVGAGSINVPGLHDHPFDFARGRSVDAKGPALSEIRLERGAQAGR